MTPKSRKSKRPKKRAAPPRGSTPSAVDRDPIAADLSPSVEPDTQIMTSNLSLHELFAQQAAAMLERADLGEEQRQNILVAMSCPCCGAGGMSFTAKLKRKT